MSPGAVTCPLCDALSPVLALKVMKMLKSKVKCLSLNLNEPIQGYYFRNVFEEISQINISTQM